MRTLVSSAVVVFLFAGCAVDPLEDIGPSPQAPATENPESIHAWIWAFSAADDSVHVFHTVDKQRWKSFGVPMDPALGFANAGLVGGGIYPTLWTAGTNSITALTNGILDHGDHGHIVHPRLHATIALGLSSRVTDRSVSPDKARVVFAVVDTTSVNPAGRLILVRVSDGDTTILDRDVPVTRVVDAGDRILCAGYGDTAAIISVSTATPLAAIVLDAPEGSGVYHASTHTAFVACRNGIEMIDMVAGATVGSIPYGGAGRVTTLWSEGDIGLALGWCAATGSDGNGICVLDMAARTLRRIELDNAILAGAPQIGGMALCDNGATVVVTDMAAPVLYRVNLREATVERTLAPAAACPVACNWDGSRVWTLEGATAYQVSFALGAVVDSIQMPAATDRIMVSSFRDNNALFDSNDHTF